MMTYQKWHQQIIFLSLVVIILAGCGGSASAVVSEAPTATATPEQPAPIPTMLRLPRKEVERPALTITLPEGNPGRGYALSQKLDCVNCHLNSPGDAPPFGADGELPAILTRAEMRIAEPAYSGSATTPEEYLIESITDPRLYEVDGYDHILTPGFPSKLCRAIRLSLFEALRMAVDK
jgi:hypothetical protein